MKQGTTYPIIITVPGIDLSGADWIIVSIKPRMRPGVEFGRDQMAVVATESETTLTVALTQAESLAMPEGNVVIDVNWMMDGIRGGCVPTTINITDTLLKRVVTDNG